ncbi:glycosyltransferase family 4 protein [Advenella sp. RU8]|uniref:glycosyltransferase family 4 protein n=1 Tax=Advenella sp. RU8 TaxID=3399575 RepID=UPI003AAA7FF7
MKILIVNTLDIKGGAAKAAYRLHHALRAEGVDSHMLVQNKSSDDFTVIGPITSRQKVLSKIRPFLDMLPLNFYKNRTKTFFSPAWVPFSDIVSQINKLKPDIVHLHWITGGMMRIEDIARINAPVVWSLHDDWAFTGGCHIKWECKKYTKSCGACPRLDSSKEKDLSYKVWRRKRKIFSKKKLTIIGVSQWLTNCSLSSSLLGEKSHVTLPNPLNTQIFKPQFRKTCRKLWNLPYDKKLILFGANSATSDINKGFKELSEALKLIKTTNIEFVVFGSSEPEEPLDFACKTHYLGHLYDEVSLVALYSAVDVMLVPSLQEAFGQTASESMACGTPVVAFGATGLLDIVDHKNNGYLANAFDSSDLANGIDWVLEHDDPQQLADNARQKIVKCFDSEVIARKYINLYRDILSKET